MLKNKKELYLILDNIRSTYNVGAIFRTVDAAGVAKIYLAGVTPTPTDKFQRKNASIAKTALGAEESVPWEYGKTTSGIIKKLQKIGVQVVALEQDPGSIDYKKFKPEFPCAIVLGEETKGLPKSVLKLCDQIIEIPMRGSKESLNVSVAVGVTLFEIISK
jgi:23S rRNA (guanosine2251-2'-O)-methyltransferase